MNSCWHWIFSSSSVDLMEGVKCRETLILDGQARHWEGELLKTGIYGSGSTAYSLGTGHWATSHLQTEQPASPPHKCRFAFPSNGIIYNPSKLKLRSGTLPPPHFPWGPSKQGHASAAGMRADVLAHRIPVRVNVGEWQLRAGHWDAANIHR